jgi:hypothetical protein
MEERNGRIGRIDPVEIMRQLRNADPPLLGLGNDDSLVPDIAPRATDRFALLRVSWRGHPDQYSPEGIRQRLRLPPGAGLSVPTHFRFFRDNVVAAEINRAGPAPTALLDYIYGKGDERFFRLRMRRIADRETTAKINRIRTLSSVRIRIPERSIGFLQRSGNIYLNSLVRPAEPLEEGGVFEVAWRTFRGNGRLNADALKALSLNLIEAGDDLGKAAQVELIGVDRRGAPVEYTLARDYVTSRQPMTRDADGNIEARIAYDALERGYNEAVGRFSPQLFIPNG